MYVCSGDMYISCDANSEHNFLAPSPVPHTALPDFVMLPLQCEANPFILLGVCTVRCWLDL